MTFIPNDVKEKITVTSTTNAYRTIRTFRLIRDYQTHIKGWGTAVSNAEKKQSGYAREIRYYRASLKTRPEQYMVLVWKTNAGRTISVDRFLPIDATAKTRMIVLRELREYLRNDYMRVIRAEKQRARQRAREPRYTERQIIAFGKTHFFYMCAGVHMEAGVYMKLLTRKKRDLVERSKKPLRDVRYLGIEIECIISGEYTYEDLIKALLTAKLEKYVQLKGDGSIIPGTKIDGSEAEPCPDCGEIHDDENEDRYENDGGDFGVELAVCVTERMLPKVIRQLCAVLAEHGAYVNDTCGLHVHIDMRARDTRRVYRNLFNTQDLLFALVPRSRRKNKFCKPHDDCNFDDAYGYQSENDRRYFAINTLAYREHKSFEIRLHSGTTSATKIIYWCKLLIKIVNSTKLVQTVDTLTELRKRIPMTTKMYRYLKGRIQKFKNRSASEEAIAA